MKIIDFEELPCLPEVVRNLISQGRYSLYEIDGHANPLVRYCMYTCRSVSNGCIEIYLLTKEGGLIPTENEIVSLKPGESISTVFSYYPYKGSNPVLIKAKPIL